MNYSEISEKISNGGIGILPTDTMYGVVGSAMDKDVVEKVYAIRERNPSKPFVVLVGSIDDVLVFNPDIGPETKSILEKIWPAPVSVILPVPGSEFEYLSRGTGTVAMRLPHDLKLRELLLETGPLVAPSANTEGNKPAGTLEEAKTYFPDLEFYIDGGELPNNPSTLISLENSKAKVLRQGAWKIPDFLI